LMEPSRVSSLRTDLSRLLQTPGNEIVFHKSAIRLEITHAEDRLGEVQSGCYQSGKRRTHAAVNQSVGQVHGKRWQKSSALWCIAEKEHTACGRFANR
jgi:hypothetical protein